MSHPQLYACGSNGSSQLALSHSGDTSVLQPCTFDVTLQPYLPGSTILDICSASTHSLLLLDCPVLGSNLLLGAGTNTLGQLGPRCALWDEVKPVQAFKVVDLLGPLGLSHEDWVPMAIAVTWTTSLVLYSKRGATQGTSTQESSSSGLFTASSLDEPTQILLSTGSNDFGELGQASTPSIPRTPSSAPYQVDLDLSPGEWVEHLQAAQKHVVLVISTGRGPRRTQRLVGWGAARKGELDPSMMYGEGGSPGPGKPNLGPGKGKGKGKGKAAARPSVLPPTQLVLALMPGELIRSLRLGASHTLVLTDRGLYAWGSDLKSQIARLDTICVDEHTRIAASWNGSYVYTQDGNGVTIYSQGSNSHSQLLRAGDGSGTRGRVHFTAIVDSPEDGRADKNASFMERHRWWVKKMVAGTEHLLVVMEQEEGENGLWAGGWNEHGNLGLGDQVDRSELVRVKLGEFSGQQRDARPKVERVWAGCAATWVCLGG
jgi:protein ATS1